MRESSGSNRQRPSCLPQTAALNNERPLRLARDASDDLAVGGDHCVSVHRRRSSRGADAIRFVFATGGGYVRALDDDPALRTRSSSARTRSGQRSRGRAEAFRFPTRRRTRATLRSGGRGVRSLTGSALRCRESTSWRDGPSPWAPQTPSFLKSLTIVRRRDHRRVTSPGTARQRRRHPIAAVRGKATAAAPAARAATAAAADGQPFRQSFL